MRQIEGFVAAARLRSFTEAARALSMTQPAFSQLVKDLETSVGVQLFQRTTRRIELTDAGASFLARVERPLEDLRDAFGYLADRAAGRCGRVVLSVLPSIAAGYAIPALAAFKETYPDVTVQLIEDHNRRLIERVVQREVDFAIGTLHQAHDDVLFRKLLADDLLVVYPARHRFGSRGRVTWRDLASEPLILTPHSSSVRELVTIAFAQLRIQVEPAYEVANTVTAVSMARAGIAITVVPRIAVSGLNVSDLGVARIHAPLQRRSIGIITRADRPLSAAAAAYVDMLSSLVTSSGTPSTALQRAATADRLLRSR